MLIIDISRYVIYFVLLFICAWTDLKKGKIYNKNLLLYLIFFIFTYVIEYLICIINKKELQYTNDILINRLYGFLISFIIGFVFYILGIFKGGDSKLLSIVGLLSGKDNLLIHLIIIILVAGVFALYVLIKNKIFIKRFKRVFLYLRGLLLTLKFEKYTTDDDNIKFPFAIYILIGEIISYIYLFIRG